MKIEIYRYALCLMLVFASVGGADYRIVWSTLDGGGGTISGGPYLLTNTIGQPDAAISAGGDYELLGGFWPAGRYVWLRWKILHTLPNPGSIARAMPAITGAAERI
jgi:hypothetical protein